MIISIMVLALITIIYMPKIQAPPIEEVENKKIGIILTGSSGSAKINGMIKGLEQYGYSKNHLDITIKETKGEKDRIESSSRELVDEEMDIIIVTGPFEAKEIKKHTEDIPLVFIGVGCSVELGLVGDNISTGCNITGVDSHYVQLSGKRLEFLKKIVPDTREVLILYNPTITPIEESERLLQEGAKRLGIGLKILPVKDKDEIIFQLQRNKDHVQGAMLMCNFLLDSSVDSIVEAGLEYKIPIMGINDYQVNRGFLGFYGSTNYNEGIQAARIVANILKGQDPRIIPIEVPEKLEFHLNLNTAEILDIDIDKLHLTFVDKLIKK